MVAKISNNLQTTPSHQFIIIKHKPESLRGSYGRCKYCVFIFCFTQFLDGSSNQKAGCKENAFYDALDANYVSCIYSTFI